MTKRKHTSEVHKTAKRQKLNGSNTIRTNAEQIQQPLLARCYQRVQTLKDYLLAALPTASRVRRKRLLSLTESFEHTRFLTKTLVGLQDETKPVTTERRLDNLGLFTQTRKPGHHLSATGQPWTIEEVIEFVIWSLFKECDVAKKRPNHIICHGLDRSMEKFVPGFGLCKTLLPGIIQRCPNPNRDELLQPVWRELLTHLGMDALPILTTLLMDHGIFVESDYGIANLRQLSGVPVHDLTDGKMKAARSSTTQVDLLRKPSEVKFTRNRILYGKPTLNHKGEISFGFKSIHILNRLAGNEDSIANADLMRYIFPRQFKLHNVFNSETDRRETTQAFRDYTTRSDEIDRIDLKSRTHLPRRLRGEPARLVGKIRTMHRHCSYAQLLYHYCPILAPSIPVLTPPPADRNAMLGQDQDYRTQPSDRISTAYAVQTVTPHEEADPEESSFLPYAVSKDHVSAFCRSVLVKIIPGDFLGSDQGCRENWRAILGHVDKFVGMRRFETSSLHEVCQGLKLRGLEWLIPSPVTASQRLAESDKRKREEILHEFVYYLFDSLLIPLLHSNFYVTESGVHRNKLLYFRHDVWQRLCRPTLTSLRLGSLVPVTKAQTCHQTNAINLGHSTVRLLPKDIGTRPIANLRRRIADTKNGGRFLGPSINNQLRPVFDIFNYERREDEGIFRSDSFSQKTLEQRLSAFKLRTSELLGQPLYFVKVDIQSAFDSIPQEKLLNIVSEIFNHDQYCITKYAVGKNHKLAHSLSRTRAAFRFIRSARPLTDLRSDEDLHRSRLHNKKHIVTSDMDWRETISSDQAKRILQQHILNNVVKLDRKYYKKSEGIAQGSVLSSLLCAFFYNDFEMSALGFLDARKSIILRIMDDFLLITFDRGDALHFVTAMKAGDSSYGIRVNPEKSLVNFDVTIDGIQVPKLIESSLFPFCGLFIDISTLQVSKNRVRKDNVIANSLTVDLHGQAGAKFKRRIMSSLRIQLQSIVLNHKLNDEARISQTLIEGIQETTMKMHQYYTSMPATKRPKPKFLIDVVQQLMNLTARLVTENCQRPEIWTRSRVHCLIAAGIIKVFNTRKSQYAILLSWLRKMKSNLIHSLDMSQNDLERLVDRCFESVQHYHF